jgi:hypothetical protein
VPRFFFNFRQGSAYEADDMGNEFENVEEAYLAAFAGAQDYWRELLIRRQDPLLCAFEVMDEQGHEVFVLEFSEVLDACRRRVPQPTSRVKQPLPMQQAFETRQRAQRVMREVTDTVADARKTLRETWTLLAQVSRSGVD